MVRAGVVGIGDMGSGLAKNLIEAGHETVGYDPATDRMARFRELGGRACESAMAVGSSAEVVFVMVMDGAQAHSVILGEQGLVQTLEPGAVILLTATIRPAEARAIGEALDGSGIHLIDSPVSGGFPGAQSGTLTMMAAGSDAAFERAETAMQAVAGQIHRVGESAGQGQTIKACLQSLIGSVFTATFEASVLAAKAGVSGQVLYEVVSSSGVGCGITRTALQKVIDREFEGTGSHIATMHKDLTISLDLARELGVPLHTASTAMQLFHAGKTRYPDGDNWIVTKVLEEIVGAELHRDGAERLVR